jgi:hypothetical protein
VERLELPLHYVNKTKQTTQTDLDLKNRIVAITHGLLTTFFAAYHFFSNPGTCGSLNTEYEKKMIQNTVGYFIYDFSAMAYYGLLDQAMTYHHWLCIIGMTVPLTYGQSANFIVQGMFISEVSNAYMHFRIILKQHGLRYTKSYEAMEILFMVLYFIGRLVIGTGVVWNTISCQNNYTIVKLASVALFV